MVLFRYQAIQSTGVPVFGMEEADDESALRASLAGRRLTLVQSIVVLQGGPMVAAPRAFPRLYQLRIGDRLREASLTGLPAHEAVRAMAAEPFEHPLLQLMPAAMLLNGFLLLLAFGWLLLAPGSLLPLILCGTLVALMPGCWVLTWWTYAEQPRRLLHRLASRLESGEDQALVAAFGLPREVRSIMNANVAAEQKALSTAELIPQLMGSRFHTYQLLLSLCGSALTLAAFLLGTWLILWQVVPSFAQLLRDFDTEVPPMTKSVLFLSDLIEAGSFPGFLTACGASLALVMVIWFSVTSGRVSETIAGVPLLGTPVRWLMQARVARVLAAMLQHHCDPAESLRTATAASAFNAVRRDGEEMANLLREGGGIVQYSPRLSALPLSLLSMVHSRPEAHAQKSSGPELPASGLHSPGLAQDFNAIAQMLERISVGHGRFLGTFLQFGVLTGAAAVTAYIVIALFLPLIKLLNDLA